MPAEREFVKDEIRNVKDEIHNLRRELKECKSAIIKWMFVFWATSTLTTLAALFGLVKFFIK